MVSMSLQCKKWLPFMPSFSREKILHPGPIESSHTQIFNLIAQNSVETVHLWKISCDSFLQRLLLLSKMKTFQ